jgi:putative hydrolase of the HAD superfamily
MIFFDIDDTLIDHRQAQERAALELYQEFGDQIRCSREDFPPVWRQASRSHFIEFIRGGCSLGKCQRRCIREVFHRTKMTDDEADEIYGFYLRHYESNWVIFPDVIPALDALQQQGFRLGILSTGDGEQQRTKLDRLGLTSRFNSILVPSPEPGITPFKNLFTLAVNEAQVSAEECAYVGGDLKNYVMGAAAAGWRAIWLDRTGIMKPAGDVEVITSLKELPLRIQIPRLRDWF